MPWAHDSDYLKQKNSELKILLQMRSLAYTGNKRNMVARLVAYDNEQSVLCSPETVTGPDSLTSYSVHFHLQSSHPRFETRYTDSFPASRKSGFMPDLMTVVEMMGREIYATRVS